MQYLSKMKVFLDQNCEPGLPVVSQIVADLGGEVNQDLFESDIVLVSDKDSDAVVTKRLLHLAKGSGIKERLTQLSRDGKVLRLKVFNHMAC